MNDATPKTRLTHFMPGRDLAVEMLREAQRPDAMVNRSIRADEREAEDQDDFVRTYVQRVIDDPRLLDGFASVLSDALGFCGGLEPRRYEVLQLRDVVKDPAAR